MNRSELLRLAEDGARARMVALQREMLQLRQTFPHLFPDGEATLVALPPELKARKPWSEAARKAASERMKRWHRQQRNR